MAFIDDIQSRDTALFPVIEFDISGGTYRISTQSLTLENNLYSPLLLSSPSVKESIDLENRKYKISTVSLKISNVEYGGLRFSDTQVPYNTPVSIWWVSPSCSTLSDCYLAYRGTVRDITHDEKACNITLEDLSQTTLHADVPINVLSGDDVIDKYKNKPIPMVYGTVDKSPCVIGDINIDTNSGWGDEGIITSDSFNVFLDYNDSVNSQGENPLMGYKDAYINMLESYDNTVSTEFGYGGASPQYTVGEVDEVTGTGGNIITLNSTTFLEAEAGTNEEDQITPSNSISYNEIIGFESVSPSSMRPNRTEWYSGSSYYPKYLTASDNTTPPDSAIGAIQTMYGSMLNEGGVSGNPSFWDGESLIEWGDDIWWVLGYEVFTYTTIRPACLFTVPVQSSESGFAIIRSSFSVYMRNMRRQAFSDYTYASIDIRWGGNSSGDYAVYEKSLIHYTDYYDDTWESLHEHNSIDGSDAPVTISFPSELSFYTEWNTSGFKSAVRTDFGEIIVDHYMHFTNMLDIDLFARDVQGRKSS